MRVIILALAITAAACSLKVDRTSTAFECDPGGTCPDGFTCVDNYCLSTQPPGCSDAVAAGAEHTCALRSDHSVWCWGQNSNGQLGDDSTVVKTLPAQVADLSDVVALDAGASFTCAATKAAVWCWGLNSSGQLGDGSTSDSRRPAQVRSLMGATAVAAGNAHACALAAGGAVSCWGANNAGQLGDGTTSTRGMPVPVSTLPAAKAIAAGGDHTCAIDMGGQLYCWGSNGAGELGLGMTGNPETAPKVVPGLTGVKAVAAGGAFTCAIADGGLMCWGSNGYGALGTGSPMQSTPSPMPNAMPVPAVSLTAGADHACAGDDKKGLWCWGRNGEAQLGDSTPYSRPVPVKTGFIEVVNASAGGLHTCVLFQEGGISCTGADTHGQLGDGRRTIVSTPQPVPDLAKAATIGAGGAHTCAGLKDGTVECWGDNSQGQVGDGSFTTRVRPTQVIALSGVDAVTGGGSHTCGQLSDGGLVCWGANNYGQLGDGTNNTSSIPRPVALGGAPTQLQLGPTASCAIVDGIAKCWGSNASNMPTDVGNGLTGLIGLARGNNHTCAIRSDRAVVCWGNAISNNYGQLGRGDTLPPNSPTEIVPTGITGGADKIYAVSDSTCVVMTDQTGRCWGRNNVGQLGIQQVNLAVPSPSPIVGLSGIVQLAMRPTGNQNEEGACARKADGTIACWGSNGAGQIGDGTFNQRTSPVPVPAVTDVVDLAVGPNHTCVVKSDGTAACWGSAASGQLGDGARATITPVTARMTCP